MPKNVEDIIPSGRRSIRDIPVPEKRRRTARPAEDAQPAAEPVAARETKKEKVTETYEETYRSEPPEVSIEKTHTVEKEEPMPRMQAPLYREKPVRRRGSGKKGLWIGGAIGLVVVGFAVFSLFRSATLAYTPKSAPLTFENEQVNAYKTGSNGVLLFSVVKISDDKGVSVKATGQTQVSKKASGRIVIYNENSAAQQLVKSTRFESPDGKIYRIQNDVTIPGKSGSTPGSLEVTVIADQPGVEGNIGLVDFTIPGFKGSSKYQTVYARSKTAMSGGFVGMQAGVDGTTLEQAKTNIETALRDKLIEEAQAQVPAEFILFPSLSTVSFEDMPQSSSTDNAVTINERGNFYGVIFKKADLAEYIKQKKLSLPETQRISIQGLENLTFAFTGNPPADLLNASQVSFTVSGTATAILTTDEAALKKDLAGKSKSDLASILKNYPGIASADATIRPFWKSSFPDDEKNITLKQKSVQ